MSKRLSVVVGENDYTHLQHLAAVNGMTVSELVRECLRVGVWYEREIKPHPDWTLILEREDGRQSALTLLS